MAFYYLRFDLIYRLIHNYFDYHQLIEIYG